MKFINLDKQFIKNKKKISSNIKRVISKGNFILGEEVAQLENKLSKYVNSNYCITTSNGTDALLMSLIALDIKPGDEVITSPFSFISAAEVINNIGAKPVFVDVDYDTFNINYKLIEKKITTRTKAIIPVNLFGQCADYDQINFFGKKYNLKIIEDAAQSFGAKYNNKMSCSLADISCTSFFPSKPLGCYGDGGACFTKSKKIYDKLKSIRSHGSLKKYTYSIRGINGRLDTIQAAVLLAKLKHFDAEIKSRN
ncbi:DegT/DnrJ/EryC1/StrS family aminotransferase, partial [Pelagibacteraceae bacterium]|nr:DegT/DnrJ/EryC1/StrS family aminotransferase [Pelagibacteraceae bacterium]